MKKKVLVISERVPFPSDNGGKLRTANVLKHLCDNYEVDYVTYSQDPVSDDQLSILKQLCNRVYIFPEGRPSKWKHLKAFLKGESGITCGIYSKNMQKKIDELIQQVDYHMLWVERLFCLPYLKKQIKKSGNNPPVILNMHDVDSEAVKYFSEVDIRKIKRLYFKNEYKRVLKLEEYAIKNVHRIIACSPRDAIVYKELFPFNQDKWLEANNGVDLKIANSLPRIKRDKSTVLFIGGLDNPCNREGILWFLNEIWDEVLNIVPEAQLLIAGSGKSASIIKESANKKSNVKFLGYVEDINPLYQQSTCTVVPLRSGSGTRLKIVEAFSFGMPVVSTSIGAEGLPVENNKDLIIADDSKAFARGIASIIQKPELGKTMANNAYTIAKQYDWDAIMSNLLEEVEASL